MGGGNGLMGGGNGRGQWASKRYIVSQKPISAVFAQVRQQLLEDK